MIVEIAIIRAKAGQADAMCRGFQAARAVIAQADGYRGSVFHQGIEDPQRFVLRIEWDSAEGHMGGFRSSPEFQTFLQAIGPFVHDIDEMRHYQVMLAGGG